MSSRPWWRSPVAAVMGVVLVIASALRFWEIGTNFHFMGDEGTQTGVEWRLIHGQLPGLGPSLSIGSMHLGPLFYYVEAIPLWISNGSPVGPTVLVGLFGVASAGLLFLYLRPFTGEWPAAGAAAVMAVSLLMVEYSRRPWNPTPTPFFTLLLLFAMARWARASRRWVVVVSAALATCLQLQPVNIFLVVLVVAFVIVIAPPMPSRAELAAALAAFVALFSPSIVYDLTHRFVNARAWLNAFSGGQSHASPSNASSPRLLFSLFVRAYAVPWLAGSILLSLAVCAAAVYVLARGEVWTAAFKPSSVRERWSNTRRVLTARVEILLPVGLMVIAAIGFEVYRKAVFEQYLVCLFVVPFIFLGVLFMVLGERRWSSYLAIAVLAVVLVIGCRHTVHCTFEYPETTAPDIAITQHYLQPDDIYGHVREVSRWIAGRAQGRPFALESASTFDDSAYAYVLQRMGDGPVSPARLRFVIIEPENLPRAQWSPMIRRETKGKRTTTIGITKLIVVGG